MILEEIKKIKSDRKDLRNFGITMGIALGVIGGLLLWREKPYYFYCVIAGIAFLLSGFAFPAVLKPFQKVWMTISILMGWLMTRVILIILFYGILTPIGLIGRLCGKDFLDIKLNKNAPSYWVLRGKQEYDKKSYEQQF
jgi:hypothetical protein